MNEMIAFCGLDCHQCGAFLATRDDDNEKRREVADLWSREYGADIKAQDIHCEGCLTVSGIVFGHCDVCEIRKCGQAKGVTNCAYCRDYVCSTLVEFFTMVPEAKARLDGIKEGL